MLGATIYVIAGGTEPGYSFPPQNEAIDLAALRN